MKNNVLEVKEVSEKEILDEVILHKKYNSEWLGDCFVRGIPGFDFIKQSNRDTFWLWLVNGAVVGYSYLRELKNFEAEVTFQVKDDFNPPQNVLQQFVEDTLIRSFNASRWKKVFYTCGEKCSGPLTRAFLQRFKPYPIGWVHLDEGKFVLTRERLNRTEEEFYKM